MDATSSVLRHGWHSSCFVFSSLICFLGTLSWFCFFFSVVSNHITVLAESTLDSSLVSSEFRIAL